MAVVADPTGTGIVRSLARPGGNITGLNSIAVEIDGKRLEFLRDIAPTLSRVGVFWNPANPVGKLLVNQTKLAADSFGLQLPLIPIQEVGQIEQASATMIRARPDIVVVIDIEPIRERFSAVAPFLDERGRRLVAAAEETLPSGRDARLAGTVC
jgi:putative tryptophan/tyrosine transport system substrate-binding protein